MERLALSLGGAHCRHRTGSGVNDDSESREKKGNDPGVEHSLASVILAAHTIERVLSYDVAEAEAFYGRPFDPAMDEHIQLGMLAPDRIAADEMLGKVVAAIATS